MTVVLDSWAILRYVDTTEPAALAVAGLLDRERPVVSWINLGEVFYVLRRQHDEGTAMETLRDLRADLDAELPADVRVLEAARLNADFRMSYADGFAAATAIAHRAELWTGDPELLVDGAPWRWRDLRS